MKLVTTQQSFFIAGGHGCQLNDYKCITMSYSLAGAVGAAVAGVALTSTFALPGLVCFGTGVAGLKVGAMVGYVFGLAAYEQNMKAISMLEEKLNLLEDDVFTPQTV